MMQFIGGILDLKNRQTVGLLNLMTDTKSTSISTLVSILLQLSLLGMITVLLWLLVLLQSTITTLLSIGVKECSQWNVLTRFLTWLKGTRLLGG